jgi:hypothetical protein
MSKRNHHFPAIKAAVAAVMIAACALVMPSEAFAEKRVALIVGNSTYQTVPQLPNPSRDAASVGQMFRDAGFETVDVQLNLGNLEFKRSIRKFEVAADQADIAVIYYAGHGIEIGGTNYLVPTDARLASDRDADDEAIPLERLVSSADGAKKLRVIILDACRDNPFTTTMRRERKVASRAAVSSGLSKVEPTSTDTLIAYAAKAGSTAEDGDGKNSPFTTAILKNLTVPGLDIRLAFGRVRDEVMKSTGNRQEPFVYGSLGGGNISLVPAPAAADAPTGDVKADYDLVAKIGSRRAWEVFLNTYKTGFYADLARAQVASLSDQVPAQPAKPGNIVVAAVGPSTIAPGRDPNSKEALDYDRLKDSTDIDTLRRFVKKYPDSPLSITVQQKIDVLTAAQQEREARARNEREAAQKAAEEARVAAEQRRVEQAAQRKREDDERRARAAEAEQQAKAAAAERKAAEARQKAEEAERNKASSESAALRADSERQARAAEDERRKAERASAQEAQCQNEQSEFNAVNAKSGDDNGLAALKTFAAGVTCERLRPLVTASIDRLSTESAKRAAAQPNSPELIRAAQTQLARVGCFAAKPDGVMANPTRVALGRFYTAQNRNEPAADAPITESMVDELTKQTARVCPLECKADETAKGEVCVANAKPSAPATASRRNRDDDEDDTPRRKPALKRQPEREARQSRPAPEPRARQQAAARPSGGGGGGGGGHTMIGVGF